MEPALSFRYNPANNLLTIILCLEFHPEGEYASYELPFYINEAQKKGLPASLKTMLKVPQVQKGKRGRKV